MNLIHDAWIPVDRQSGPNQRIAPWQITDTDDPVLGLAAPRPDFNGALLQFYIGLLQTTCAPATETQWEEWFERPPSPQDLKQHFDAVAEAFYLDGEAPRFLQDHTLLREANPAEISIDGLLLDANETHFNKPGKVNCARENCAALAILALQLNSPEGGRGHYTSLRGGGPLTTLVVIEEDQRSFWRDLWLNVLNAQTFHSLNAENSDKSPHRIFPWLAPEKFVKAATKRDIFPVDINGAQIFWSMPRRIYLKDPAPTHHCDICGEKTTSGYAGYFTRPAGISYSNDPVWRHSLSPRYPTDKTGNNLAFRHPRAGGLTYDLWPSLVLEGYEQHEIAEVIRTFLAHRRLKDIFEQVRVHAFGYHTKKNKAVCWYEATLPMYLLDEAVREQFTSLVNTLVRSSEETAKIAQSQVKQVWFKRPADAKGDTAFLTQAFFDHTETAFFSQLHQLKEQLEAGKDGRDSLYSWHKVLRRTALELFDYWTSRGDFETVNPRRIAEARNRLSGWLNSDKKGLAAVLNITLPKEKAA